ncbi:TIGR01906 family membrane protein [Paenarthrobacter sp. AR 02]|uniref:TIGR01906 family membrane protein n=1 Tax=unclassified Paenarthrobacter TaxID=2634190 RepID=UPI001F3B6129|nr:MULTISPECIES: TIGR01906 family membrane protein [unclassified Paenarthrobacter]MCF3139272.1 TIGR01906 family membrane protein [Paenarthrobacter sp. AR 02]MCR1160628.1 TIGR01906 family membrane protein [Paenarthrobacter sp. UW852]
MSDKSPKPQEPDTDVPEDPNEPAFDWMKPKTSSGASAATPEPAAGPTPKAAQPAPATTTGATPTASESTGQPETRADRKAAEAADAEPEPPLFADTLASTSADKEPSHYSEPLPTSALQVRPPEDEVARRNAEREQAAKVKPVGPRIFQVLLAVFYPVILLVLAVRAVTSPLFLWVEYNRPGFPGDGYGFSTDDRMTFGSYAVDYLSNWAGPRYLGGLMNQDGTKLFKDSEVAHMADVKVVILTSFAAGLLLIILSIIGILYLRKRSNGGIRRGLFAGSIVTLVIIIGLAVLAALSWQQFFTEFHRIFFANGTWTFSLDDTLIRLFPGQFWVDAGIVIGALVFLVATLTFIFTWPTKRRRAGIAGRQGVEADASMPETDEDSGSAGVHDAEAESRR